MEAFLLVLDETWCFEEAAGPIWSSMLGITITYTLQLRTFITLHLCGTTRLHELKV
jgi:hypothetical protein